MALQLPTSIPEAGRRLRDGSLTCATLTEAYLRSIERLQPKLNAFITITVDRALEEARTLDAELRAGMDRGALHGIPIVHKDNTSVAGVLATVGSEIASLIRIRRWFAAFVMPAPFLSGKRT